MKEKFSISDSEEVNENFRSCRLWKILDNPSSFQWIFYFENTHENFRQYLSRCHQNIRGIQILWARSKLSRDVHDVPRFECRA